MFDTRTGISQGHDRPRTCGTCDVCCTAMRVGELDKPAGARCVHTSSDGGCGIYQDRPAACRDWYCMWIRDTRGILSDAERPDRVGIFLTASKPRYDGSQVIYAHPVRPDAMSSPAAKALVERLRQYARVKVLPFQGSSTQLTHEGQRIAQAA